MTGEVRRFGAMPVDETSCDLEPIHLAGAVQPPVVMVVVRAGRIEQISENAGPLLAADPASLVGADVDELPEPFPELTRSTERRPVGRQEVRRHRGWTHVGHHHQGVTIIEAEPDGGAVMPEQLLNRLQLVVDDVDRSASFDEALRSACDAVRELTGFDRVMVYLFHEDGHGEVVAESIEEGVESFLGLHYPATDIPRQARRLFVINPTRVIADTTYEGAALIGRPDSPPVDLTYAQFRATSPIHLEYLRNMGVAASFSLSLVVDGELVGLVAAHHRTPRRLAHDTRSACGLVARILGEQLARRQDRQRQVEESERLGAQFLLLRHLTLAEGAVDAAADDLRRLLRADGWLGRLGGQVSQSGEVPDDSAIEGLLAKVPVGELWETDELPAELGYPGGALVSRFHHDGWACWFRTERRAEVLWAGNPTDGWSDDDKTLNPRASFAAWAESVRGRCEPWSRSDQAIATTIGRGLLTHHQRRTDDSDDGFQHVVESLARYAAELQMVNVDLEASNASLSEIAYVIAHDLRAPLRSIRSFLQVYREDIEDASIDLPDEAQASWEVIEESATTMQQLLNALLEWSRVRPERLTIDIVSLDDIADSASRGLLDRIDEVGGHLEIAPLGVAFGDQAMLRQVFVNLFDNAVKFRSPDRPLRLTVSATREHHNVEVTVADNGLGIPAGAEQRVFRMFDRAAPRGIDGIGAGLAIVERIVEGHGGSIEVVSAEGTGTSFAITLPLSAEGREPGS